MKTTAYLQTIDSEIPAYVDIPEPTAEGDVHSFSINYGGGIGKVGGIVEVRARRVKDGVIEGYVDVPLPFSATLDFHVTAMNVMDDPTVLTGESAFATSTASGIKIYATAKSSTTKTIPVKWSAEGIY